MKKELLLLFLIFVITKITAQQTLPPPVLPALPSDSIAFVPKKNFLRAAGITFGVNMGVWAFDRYVLDAHYAHIGFNTIKDNFRHGFIWDNDYMSTNMFAYPYHGNLYFVAGRANGLNYWESSGLAFAGSAMWELFMESEYPSANDIIATPVGGMAIGEVFFRVSDMIVDERLTGSARFGSELAAFIVAPTKGLTRILNGNAWKKNNSSGKQFPNPPLRIEIGTGFKTLRLEEPVEKGVSFMTHIDVQYGEKFSSGGKPYDYFSFRVCLNAHKQQPILGQLNIMGRLYSADLLDTGKDYFNIGIYQHYDYYDSDSISHESSIIPYRFSTPASFGVGAMHQSKRWKNWGLNSYFHFNGILLGASLSDHYVLNDRNYNLGSGFGWKTGVTFSYKDIFFATLTEETYRLFTWKGYKQDINWETVDQKTLNAQGDHSQAITHLASLRMDLKLRRSLYLTSISYSHTRDTNYKYFDNVFSQTFDTRILVTYIF